MANKRFWHLIHMQTVRRGEGRWSDGLTVVAHFRNLGDANYNGLTCPYILPELAPDQPSYFLNWSVRLSVHDPVPIN